MARTSMKPLLALFLLGPVALGACGDDKMQDTAATSSSTGDNTSTSSAGTTSTTGTGTGTGTETGTGTSPVTGTTAMSDSSTSCSFVDCGGTTDGTPNECDIWAQDCPDGEKCMPWANDGGNAWNATKCSPLDPAPAGLGDECMGGGVSGMDNCEKGSMCYYVDGETNLGVCVPFCVGSADSPMCKDINEQCSISNNGVLILCRKKCNPLLQDCMGAAACLPAAGSDKFVCIVDASGEEGQAGDPCEYLNACDPGLLCADAAVVPGCQGTGCCTEFCDITDPNKDAQCSQNADGSVCQPYYEPGTEPPGLENIGFCGLMQ